MTKKRRKLDHYYYKAKKEGYRSRAAYKIKQIDAKFKLFHPGQVIIDLCGAPGGWAQVAQMSIGQNGRVILLDLQNINNLPNVEYYQCDITSEEALQILRDVLGEKLKVDLLLADCSPKVTGAWKTDQARQIYLAKTSFRIAVQLQAFAVVTKVFQGEDLQELRALTSKHYKNVYVYKPKASRSRSAEIYLIAKSLIRGIELESTTE